jgi:putative aldouronate transport system substrate-binding protein
MIQAGLGKWEWVVNESTYYPVTAGNSTDVVNYFQTPEFVEYVTRMKRWYDKGFWSKNVLSVQTEGLNLFQEGKTYAAKSNIAGVESTGRDWIQQHPDWKVGIFLNADVKGVIHNNPVIGNGVALPRACSDIPRSLALIDKLRYDPEYYMLTQYGILGKHYNLDANGSVVPLGSNDEVGFGASAMQPWGWHVDRMEPPQAQQWAGKDELYARLRTLLKPNYVDSFAFDVAPVAAQYAALENVFNQYVMPLIVGKTSDVAADVALVNQKLGEAGVDAYLAEVKGQLTAFFTENGY